MEPTDCTCPKEWRAGVNAAAAAIRDSDRFLVSAHARLDGDAYGSLIAAGLLLRALGKEVVLYARYGVPAYLDFLEHPFVVRDCLGHLPFEPLTLLALDCGNYERLGDELGPVAAKYACINIDHHPGEGMGTLASLVLPDAAATAQVLAEVVWTLGVRNNAAMASALALGLLTDTGCFRHSCTNADVFALASRLEREGASFHLLRERLEKNWSIPKLRLWGLMESRCELEAKGAVAWCYVSLDDLARTGASHEDMEGFVERMRDIRGVSIACLIRESDPATCRVSLRCGENADVRAIAAGFGGGGHVRAAGGTVRQPLQETIASVLGAILATGPVPAKA